MKKLDLKKYDVKWEYLDNNFKTLIVLCLMMPGFLFICLDFMIILFSSTIIEFNNLFFIIPYLIYNLSILSTFIKEYIYGYKRQQIVKSNRCVDCEYYLPDAIIDACTYVGIIKEDGSVDYTLPCKKSIDKQPSR